MTRPEELAREALEQGLGAPISIMGGISWAIDVERIRKANAAAIRKGVSEALEETLTGLPEGIPFGALDRHIRAIRDRWCGEPRQQKE